MITCGACGEGNDFDSVVEVAKEKGVEDVTREVQRDLKKELEKITKRLK